MTRRLALAVALAFTTVVTFAMVAIGAQAGLFGDGGKDGAPADASAGETATAPAPTSEPTVITEYIYIDQTVTPEASGGSSRSSSGLVDGSSGGSGSEIEERHDSEDEHEEEDHESEDEEDDD